MLLGEWIDTSRETLFDVYVILEMHRSFLQRSDIRTTLAGGKLDEIDSQGKRVLRLNAQVQSPQVFYDYR